MASGDIVILVNEGDDIFEEMFNNRTYRIPPGERLMVEWDAMCLWLGHPDANDFNPRNRVRQMEYQRLRTKYGVDAYVLQQTMDKVPVNTEEVFQLMRPKLAAYDGNNGRIITVADDPAGDSVQLPIQPGDQQSLILQRMAQMEAELQRLRAESNQAHRTEVALRDAEPIMDNPDLDDRQVRVGAPGLIGTVTESAPIDPTNQAPRPPTRSGPSEDTPTRVRVSST